MINVSGPTAHHQHTTVTVGVRLPRYVYETTNTGKGAALNQNGIRALDPGVIITHRLSLEDAVRGYEIFDRKEEDCRKVILTP